MFTLRTTHCIYEKSSTKFVRIIRNGYWQDARYATLGAAKAAFNRLVKLGKINAETHAVAELGHFHQNIEKVEMKHNLVSGKSFVQPVNTPLCCDPSSETYWSM